MGIGRFYFSHKNAQNTDAKLQKEATQIVYPYNLFVKLLITHQIF